MNPLPAPGLLKGREEGKSGPPALKGRARKTSPKEKMGKGCSVLQDGPGPGTTWQLCNARAMGKLCPGSQTMPQRCPLFSLGPSVSIQEMSKLPLP